MKSSLFRLIFYAWRNKQGIPSQYAVGNVVLPKNNTSYYLHKYMMFAFYDPIFTENLVAYT